LFWVWGNNFVGFDFRNLEMLSNVAKSDTRLLFASAGIDWGFIICCDDFVVVCRD